jgi:hypothetical protein
MKEHWEEARIATKTEGNAIEVTTKNVSALTLVPLAGLPNKVRIDEGAALDLSGDGSFILDGSTWKPGHLSGLRKQPGLQGPIDDALMSSFIFVTPTGKCAHERLDNWVHGEIDHAVTHWRRQMRGDAIVKLDREITNDDIANSNLILWGDFQSNLVISKIIDQLPIKWTQKEITVGDRSFDAAHHALIAVYPNPLNPEKYIVLNSSFTYREYDYLNNARQVPKLPDWAVIDIQTPPNSRYPGKIVLADFFGERWEIKPK